MAEGDPAPEGKAPARSLVELFDEDSKRFEWMAKQYYDLFAYHAAQRLTAFNFFLVSLSFFSTAYATLIARSDPEGVKYYSVAGCLAFAAYLLVVAFARLDKRNEQIIGINEKPLIRIQRAIRLGLAPDDEEGEEVWETFVQAEKSYPFRSFGDILPFIYSLAAAACAAGAMYGFSGPGERLHPTLFPLWIFLSGFAVVLIRWPLWWARDGRVALHEAAQVVRAQTVTSAASLAGPAPTEMPGEVAVESAAPPALPADARATASDGEPAKTSTAPRKTASTVKGTKTRKPREPKLPKS